MAFILLAYSVAKLTGHQFYTNPELLLTTVKEANLFQLSWFLANHEPFKMFIAISQISAALLLIFNRTAIIGAFLVIPIWINILIWDVSFMDQLMAIQFGFRIGYYLILTGLILWFYKDKIITAFRIFTEKTDRRLSKSVLLYVSLPLAGYALEFVIGKLVQIILTIFYRL